MGYVNPKKPNNGPNVPRFKSYASSYMVRRVIDPVHGEKAIYPNEVNFDTNIKSVKQKPPHLRGHQEIEWEEGETERFGTTLGKSHRFQYAEFEGQKYRMKPVPLEMNFSPFQCPQIAMLNKYFPNRLRLKSRRDVMEQIAGELRLRNVAQYQRVSIRIEQLDEEIEKLEEVNDESNKTKLGLLKEDREKTKQQLESIELDPYQFIIKAIDNLRPTVDFALLPASSTSTAKIPVPRPILERKAIGYATKWVHEGAQQQEMTRKYVEKGPGRGIKRTSRKHVELYFADRYVDELMDAYNCKGHAYQKKLAHHKIAEAQRAYAHLFYS